MAHHVALEGSMRITRSDRAVRVLTAFATLGYFLMWFGGALVLIGLPLIKAFGGIGVDFYYTLDLPVTAPALQTSVQTAWGTAPLMLDDGRGELKLPQCGAALKLTAA